MSDPRTRLPQRWLGVTLSFVVIAATVSLAVTGRLSLYIHPRYEVFTVVMAVVGGVLGLVACAALPGRDDHAGHDHAGHDHAGHEPAPRRASVLASTARLVGAVAITLATTGALLVADPAALSAAAAGQRAVNSSVTAADTAELAGADTSGFTVKEWSAVLRGSPDAAYLGANPASLDGFVVPTGDPDSFTLVRYTITHCVIDATPVGVTVRDPGWEERYTEGDWLRVAGAFRTNPDVTADAQYVLQPESIEPIGEPDEPYVY